MISHIQADDVHYEYLAGTPMARVALRGVSFAIEAGEAVGILGHTGCGKSTLIQHFNGLLRPTAGRMHVLGHDTRTMKDRKSLRFQVGLIFQFPEAQLFEDTVRLDIAYGPRNMGLDPAEVERRVEQAARDVHLDLDSLGSRSPLALSGGEMRRVAVAGVLAMQPSVLVLDEPTAGLDPGGRAEFIDLLRRLHREQGRTLILVSHDIEVVAELAPRVLLLEEGKLLYDGPLRHAVGARMGALHPTPAMHIGELLAARGVPLDPPPLTLDEAAESIVGRLSSVH